MINICLFSFENVSWTFWIHVPLDFEPRSQQSVDLYQSNFIPTIISSNRYFTITWIEEDENTRKKFSHIYLNIYRSLSFHLTIFKSDLNVFIQNFFVRLKFKKIQVLTNTIKSIFFYTIPFLLERDYSISIDDRQYIYPIEVRRRSFYLTFPHYTT